MAEQIAMLEGVVTISILWWVCRVKDGMQHQPTVAISKVCPSLYAKRPAKHLAKNIHTPRLLDILQSSQRRLECVVTSCGLYTITQALLAMH